MFFHRFFRSFVPSFFRPFFRSLSVFCSFVLCRSFGYSDIESVENVESIREHVLRFVPYLFIHGDGDVESIEGVKNVESVRVHSFVEGQGDVERRA